MTLKYNPGAGTLNFNDGDKNYIIRRLANNSELQVYEILKDETELFFSYWHTNKRISKLTQNDVDDFMHEVTYNGSGSIYEGI